jgi:hypothetical protein
MPAGRPDKYESHVKPRLMEIGQWARDGLYEYQIAKNLGVCNDTFIAYKSKYVELSEVLKEGFTADAIVENTAFKMATSGKFPIMTMWWLQNRQSQKWKRQQENVSTEGTGELKQFTEAIDNKAGKATPKAEL